MKILYLYSVVVLTVLSLFSVSHAKFKSEGEVHIESRLFRQDDSSITQDGNIALSTRLSLVSDSWGKTKIQAFARQDSEDSERHHFYLEEGWYSQKGRRWQFRVGQQIFNWSNMEAFHPIDVVNSRNLDGDIENFGKMGELSLNFRYKIGGSYYTLYYLPLFTRPQLASSRSRLHFLNPGTEIQKVSRIDFDSGELKETSSTHQWALRSQHQWEDFEFNFQILHHVDRHQPTLIVDPTTQATNLVYHPLQQLGFSGTYLWEDYIFKAEIAKNHFFWPDQLMVHGAIGKENYDLYALGGERSFSLENGWDAQIFIEYQVLSFDASKEISNQILFQNDIFMGYLINFNDTAGSEVKFTALLDVDQIFKENVIGASYSRRFLGHWKMKTGMRIITAPKVDGTPTALHFLNDDHSVFFNLTRYF